MGMSRFFRVSLLPVLPYPKKPHWLLGAPRALVTDETFLDLETYICMTHLGDPRVTLYSRGPMVTKGSRPLTLALGTPLVLRPQLASGAPTVTKRSRGLLL